VVSSGTVKLLGLTKDTAIGQTVTLTLNLITQSGDTEQSVVAQLPTPYTIRGIITDDAVSYAYVPLFSVTTVPLTTFDGLKVKVTAKEFGSTVRDQIIAKGFVVSALSDVIEQANQIFRIVQIVLAALGLVALLVSAIGMFNTMTIALLERTNEIGIMRSIGVTRADVQRLFITESMVMGFLGGVGGIIMGIILGELVNLGFSLLAHRLGGAAVDLFVVPWWFVGVILVFSSFIGLLTGIFPALRAAKMDPLEALRYK
jgi:putative ABC transport system permease protein